MLSLTKYLPWLIIIAIVLALGWYLIRMKSEIDVLKQNYRTVQAEIRHGVILDNNPHRLQYQRHEDESTCSDETYFRNRYGSEINHEEISQVLEHNNRFEEINESVHDGEQVDEQVDGQVDGQIDGQYDGQVDGQYDEQVDEQDRDVDSIGDEYMTLRHGSLDCSDIISTALESDLESETKSTKVQNKIKLIINKKI